MKSRRYEDHALIETHNPSLKMEREAVGRLTATTTLLSFHPPCTILPQDHPARPSLAVCFARPYSFLQPGLTVERRYRYLQ